MAWKTGVRSIVLCWAVAATPLAVRAERLAILVGVSEYESLPRERQLMGPVNDVRLMREVLLRRGFEEDRIRILADKVAGADLPTRENILNAVKKLARTAKRGDFVFLYFAGHGSQAPTGDDVPPEYRKPDGRQEIFLPRDVGRWDKTITRVRNAIADHELTAIVDQVRAKGAFVWAVFDACHSATFVRGSAEGTTAVERYVPPDELGIPLAAFAQSSVEFNAPSRGMLAESQAEATRSQDARSDKTAAGFVAFYAAQQFETTPEQALPEDSDDRKVSGLFTFWLAAAVGKADDVTYRQLAGFVRQQYAARNRQVPTPQFSGTHLDAKIFGDSPAARVREWPLERRGGELGVAAGLLEQVAEGSILAILPSPLAKHDAAIGYVRVQTADLLRSSVVVVAFRGKPVLDVDQIPKGSITRLVQQSTDHTLRAVYDPPKATTVGAPSASSLDPKRLVFPPGTRVRWVSASEAYDIRIEQSDGKFWLLAPGSRLVRIGPHATQSVEAGKPGTSAALIANLVRIAKAVSLLRLANALNMGNGRSSLKLQVFVKRADSSAAADPVAVPEVTDLDKVEVVVENTHERLNFDISAFYLDSGYCITAIPPRSSSNRAMSLANSTGGSRLAFPFTINPQAEGATYGLERLVVIGMPSESGRSAVDLGQLAGNCSETQRGGSSDGNAVALGEALLERGEVESTRGPTPVTSNRPHSDVISFKVVAKEAAGATKR